MQTFYSDRKGRKFVSFAGLLLTVLVLLLLNLLRLYVADKFPQYLPDMTRVRSLPERVIIAIMLFFAVLYLLFIVLALPMWYRQFRYVIYDNRIVSYSGLFTRTYSIMRFDAIQHATYVSTPLSRFTSFNFIRLSALGGNIIMFFLSDRDCRKIMSLIETHTNEAAAISEEAPLKPVTQEEEPKPHRYEEIDGGQLTLPELAEVIKHEMSQLAFFDTTPAKEQPKPEKDVAGDPSQVTFFDGDSVQLTFDDKP